MFGALKPSAQLGPIAGSWRIQREILNAGHFQQVKEVFAPEIIVSGTGVHLHDTVIEFKNRYVKGTAAQVKHEKARAVGTLLQSVGQRRRCGLIDQALNLDAGQFAGKARRMALGITEVRRHADDGLDHRLAGGGFDIGDQAAQDQRRELLGPEAATSQPDIALGPHQALESGAG